MKFWHRDHGSESPLLNLQSHHHCYCWKCLSWASEAPVFLSYSSQPAMSGGEIYDCENARLKCQHNYCGAQNPHHFQLFRIVFLSTATAWGGNLLLLCFFSFLWWYLVKTNVSVTITTTNWHLTNIWQHCAFLNVVRNWGETMLIKFDKMYEQINTNVHRIHMSMAELAKLFLGIKIINSFSWKHHTDTLYVYIS